MLPRVAFILMSLSLGIIIYKSWHNVDIHPLSRRKLAANYKISNAKMCKVLKYQLDNGLQVSQAKLDWEALKCSRRYRPKVPSSNTNNTNVQPNNTQSFSQQAVNLIKNLFASEPVFPSEDERTCLGMKEHHAVLIGYSWGNLTISDQKKWASMGCDRFFRTAFEDPAAKSDEDWCRHVVKKYNVIPMKTWGALPIDLTDTWRQKACDSFFIAEKTTVRPAGHCSQHPKPAWMTTIPVVKPDSAPVVAILAASTTRGIHQPSTKTLAICNYLLKSVVRTAECGYHYIYVLGHDIGDPFYDGRAGLFGSTPMETFKEWFITNVQTPLASVGITIELKVVPVNNTLRKPGPVFIAMARAAYDLGADFLYRVNDDTEFLTLWTSGFIYALMQAQVPYGAIGPLSYGTDNRILTHDFVHRTHMEIFEMNYYPPEFTDWWCDDWISVVYGQERTWSADIILVTHHTGAHGQRYEVDFKVQNKLKELIMKGRGLIRKWMVDHGVEAAIIRRFEEDKSESFPRRSAPIEPKLSL